MEDDFFAVIKLVSGEEIMCNVCACPEEDRIILALDHPITMKEQETPIGTVVRVEPWIKYDNDSLYFIDMDKVITITEVTNEKIITVYNEYIKEVSLGNFKTKPSKKLGYISKLEDFRKDLEKIYKSSNN
ncbi:methylamine utilization [Synechococcus phage DSL-LC03]|nr:methylamine utilization [Synechococcus phage DSL-LC03]